MYLNIYIFNNNMEMEMEIEMDVEMQETEFGLYRFISFSKFDKTSWCIGRVWRLNCNVKLLKMCIIQQYCQQMINLFQMLLNHFNLKIYMKILFYFMINLFYFFFLSLLFFFCKCLFLMFHFKKT